MFFIGPQCIYSKDMESVDNDTEDSENNKIAIFKKKVDQKFPPIKIIDNLEK